MIEVKQMPDSQIEGLLARVNYGHLACSLNDRPYIVPVNYVYHKPDIYIYTTEGLKTGIIKANPHVCLQVEEVVDNEDWQSVIVNGVAEPITNVREREEIVKLIRSANPTLSPAISIKWLDNWIKENIEVIYRIKPQTVNGRSTAKVKISVAFAKPGPGRGTRQ